MNDKKFLKLVPKAAVMEKGRVTAYEKLLERNSEEFQIAWRREEEEEEEHDRLAKKSMALRKKDLEKEIIRPGGVMPGYRPSFFSRFFS